MSTTKNRLRSVSFATAATFALTVSMFTGQAHAIAPALIGDGSMAACKAEASPDVQTDGCYEMKALGTSLDNPGHPAQVRISWDLWTTAEGYNNANWQGGIVMTRWPVEGQWKKYPEGNQSFPSGKTHEDCVMGQFNLENCYRVFNGSKGSMDLTFPMSMAGYVYEIYSHDGILADDGVSSGPSGASVGGNTFGYVFVMKGVLFKNKQGNNVLAFKCPAASKRSGPCSPAVIPKVVANIGGGEPVPFPER